MILSFRVLAILKRKMEMEEVDCDILNKAEANKLRKELQEATAATDMAWWKRAELLHKVYYSGIGNELKPIYELWGYGDWYDYVEGELGMHVSTANSDVSTAHFFLNKMNGTFKVKDHLLSRQRMRALAKCPSKVTPDKLNYWVKIARDNTVCKLEERLYGHTHRGSVSLSGTPTECRVIKQALDDLMSTGMYESRMKALVSILKPVRRKAAA